MKEKWKWVRLKNKHLAITNRKWTLSEFSASILHMTLEFNTPFKSESAFREKNTNCSSKLGLLIKI